MDSCLYKLKECGQRIDKLFVKSLLYADDRVILAPSAGELQEMVTKMNDSVKKEKKNESRINAVEMQSVRSMGWSVSER
ncbi:hypothetical protein EVAR_45634_1 [Eumeta japonica]|uniref:Reverse transcriptase domain-containing protein n=1 Tax=Eumeta variegata TaxID=151549 RepID=A0A4C1WGQ6_EUMVA|nr:hypothetical protein EVAR_45634_1 [Eumeta japonica]